jgi:hypothetical protein
MPFQAGDLPADRALGDAEFLRGAGKTAQPRHAFETLETWRKWSACEDRPIELH